MENLTHSPLAETWKPIKGYERYQISSLGRISPVGSTLILTNSLSSKGYRQVKLYRNGKPRRLLVHVLVARHFLPRRGPGKTLVNHRDGDKQNCAVTNLEWVTPARNTEHAYEIGAKTFTGFVAKAVVAICPVTGMKFFFESLSDAETHGFKRRNISDCLGGKQKTHRGLEWRAA